MIVIEMISNDNYYILYQDNFNLADIKKNEKLGII